MILFFVVSHIIACLFSSAWQCEVKSLAGVRYQICVGTHFASEVVVERFLVGHSAATPVVPSKTKRCWLFIFPLPRPWLAPWSLLNSCPSLRLLNTSFLKCYASAVPLSKTDKVGSQGADLETVCLFTRDASEWLCGITALFWDQHPAGLLSHRAPPKSVRSLVSVAIRACSVSSLCVSIGF